MKNKTWIMGGMALILLSLMMNVTATLPNPLEKTFSFATQYYGSNVGYTYLNSKSRCEAVGTVSLTKAATEGCFGNANAVRYIPSIDFYTTCEKTGQTGRQPMDNATGSQIYTGTTKMINTRFYIPDTSTSDLPLMQCYLDYGWRLDGNVSCVGTECNIKTIPGYVVGEQSYCCLNLTMLGTTDPDSLQLRVLFFNALNGGTYNKSYIADDTISYTENAYVDSSAKYVVSKPFLSDWVITFPTTTTIVPPTLPTTTTTTNPEYPPAKSVTITGYAKGFGTAYDYELGNVFALSCETYPKTVTEFRNRNSDKCPIQTMVDVEASGLYSIRNYVAGCGKKGVQVYYYRSYAGDNGNVYDFAIGDKMADYGASASATQYINITKGASENILYPRVIRFKNTDGGYVTNVSYKFTPLGSNAIKGNTSNSNNFSYSFTSAHQSFDLVALKGGYNPYNKPGSVDDTFNGIIDITLTYKSGVVPVTSLWNISGYVLENTTGDGLQYVDVWTTCGDYKSAVITTDSNGFYNFTGLMNNVYCEVNAEYKDDSWLQNVPHKTKQKNNYEYNITMYKRQVGKDQREYIIRLFDTSPDKPEINNYLDYGRFKLQGFNKCNTVYDWETIRSKTGNKILVNEPDCDFHVQAEANGHTPGSLNINHGSNQKTYEVPLGILQSGTKTIDVKVINCKDNPISTEDVLCDLYDEDVSLLQQTYTNVFGIAYFTLSENKDGINKYSVACQYNSTRNGVSIIRSGEGVSGESGSYIIDMCENLENKSTNEGFIDFINTSLVPLLQLILLLFTFGVLFKVLSSWTS